jgi:hypothetical protein
MMNAQTIIASSALTIIRRCGIFLPRARPPKTVFAAFAETRKKRRWFAEGDGHEVLQFGLNSALAARSASSIG